MVLDMNKGQRKFDSMIVDLGLSVRAVGDLIGCSGAMVHGLRRGQVSQPGLRLAVKIHELSLEKWPQGAPITPADWLLP